MANEEVADRYFESIKDRDFAPILKAELLKIGISTEVPIAGQGFQSLNDVKDVTFGMLFGLLALTFAVGPSNWHNQASFYEEICRFYAVLPGNETERQLRCILAESSMKQKFFEKVKKFNRHGDKSKGDLLKQSFSVCRDLTLEEQVEVYKRILDEKETTILELSKKLEDVKSREHQKISRIGGYTKANNSLKGQLAEIKASPQADNHSSCICSKNTHGLIMIESQEKGIIKGQKYDRNNSNNRKITMAILPEIVKTNVAVGKRSILERGRFLWNILELVSGSNEISEIIKILISLIRNKRDIFRQAAEAAGQTFIVPLTVEETLSLLVATNMTWSMFRKIQSCLVSHKNLKVFASEIKMRKLAKPYLKKLHDNSEVVSYMLAPTANEPQKSTPCFRVMDLVKYLEDIIADEMSKKFDLDNFNDEIWLQFGGDKGGNSMKFHVEVLNAENMGSVYNVMPYCIYEGADNYLNLAQVHFPYLSVYLAMQDPTFRLKGKAVKVFLGGDFKYLYTCLGHQGASASFPSLKDTISLTHLQKHGGVPHTPEHCKDSFHYREFSHYPANHFEGKCDGRIGGPSGNGRHHESVNEYPLFPIKLGNLVPPVLHIKLGVVLKLHNMVLSFCRAKDNEALISGEPDRIEMRDKNSEEWQRETLELENTEAEISKLASMYIDYTNIKERLACGLDRAKLITIAKESTSDGNSKVRKGKRTKKPKEDLLVCEGNNFCLITHVDTNVNWIDCHCEPLHWVHWLCQGLSDVEGQELVQDPTTQYTCLRCRGQTFEDLEVYIEKKISEVETEQQALHHTLIQSQSLCIQLRATVEKNIGPLEKKLEEVIDNLGVKRQAYHGFSFVGNHCNTILKNAEQFCSVLDGYEDEKNKFLEIFEIFWSLMKLCMKKSFLDPEEIEEVSRLANRLGERFPVLFPKETIIQKMHETIFHIPRFVRTHGSLGIFSEEEGEALHNVFNRYNRQLACMKNTGARLGLLLDHHVVSNHVDRSITLPVKRKFKDR